MTCLTLTQPWAWLICCGRKHYETRSWRTRYRGPLAIHAAATLKPAARLYARERNIDLKFLPLGAVVATTKLIDCIPTGEIRRQLSARERDAGDYAPGRWAWQLDDIRVLSTPIPAKGMLGLWEWNP
jgi:hypothetical protein